jgi:tRNA (guanine37-N1)-methyltransferase
MTFHVLTLFPDMIKQMVNHSILARAIASGYICVNAVNIRDFAVNKHGQVDDAPYGGGAGMVMMPQPVYDAWVHVTGGETALEWDALTQSRAMIGCAGEVPVSVSQANPTVALTPPCTTNRTSSLDALSHSGAVSTPALPVPSCVRTVYLTPQGRPFTQTLARELSKESEIILLCGHYEGLDERVIEEIVTDEISIGDYVLTGGEPAALVLMDAVSRLIPGVINKEASYKDESFGESLAGLLEYPHYTRPPVFRGREVPEVLLSGHHGRVEAWRKAQSLERTERKRPDLL